MVFGLDPRVIVVALVGGYLLGSIPFGVLVMRAAGAGDPRSIGSGSIGATNVLRSGRRGLAVLTVLGDGGKGALAVLGGWLATRGDLPDVRLIVMCVAGGAAFLGHLFPVWLGFKGGKGVATFFGTLLAVAWPVGIVAGAAWLAVAFLFRISSVAGLTAAVVAPVAALMLGRPVVAVLALFMAVLVYLRHAPNIRRLLKGEEPRIGGGAKAA